MPDGAELLNPYRNPVTWKIGRKFYRKYYGDSHARTLTLGINPGRFGAGLTGIPFTDPVHLENVCGIPNYFAKKPELSAAFVHEMIRLFGGPERFYRKFYISSVSPLGFTRGTKNYNYFD